MVTNGIFDFDCSVNNNVMVCTIDGKVTNDCKFYETGPRCSDLYMFYIKGNRESVRLI